MSFDAIFWDMDGTLVDTERVVWDVMQSAFEEVLGFRMDEKLFENLLGQSERDFFKGVGKKFKLNDEQVEQIRELFHSDYVPALAKIPPLPGALDAVRHSHTRHKIALVTGSTKRQALAVLEALGLQKQFEHIISCDIYENGKPHPEPYLTAAKKLKARPEKSLAVEDSPAGIASALAAGMKVVAVHEGNKGKADTSGAHIELPTLEVFNLDEIARDLGL
ncbi:phosphoglycolate phosphatase [uncultured bacterium]|nr:phosphoglycolate phosphatase [uncultured bacterium]